MGSTVTSARVTGALLVERGLVTPAQLAEALEHQRANGGELEDVLQYLFSIEPQQIAAIVAKYRRREISVDIGSLLIAAGAVDEEPLDEARRRSVETGQPVGPILVEMGAITRLELASALADQWSDSPAQILPPPGAAERFEAAAMVEDVADLRFAMRALEDSVRVERLAEAGDDALEQIQRREDALAARVAALEIAVEQPLEIDPRLADEVRATAERLAALQEALTDVARTDDLAALAAALDRLEALQEAVASLDARTTSLPEPAALARALDDLAHLAERLDDATAATAALASRAELDAVREALDALANRPQGDVALAERVAELGRSVDALAVVADAAAGADGLREAVAGLTERIDGAAAAAARAEGDLSALREAVAELEAGKGRLDELAGKGDRVEQELAELRASLAAVSTTAHAIEEATTESAATAARTADEVESMRAAVAELAALPERVDELEAGSRSRQEELAGELRALQESLAEVAGRPASDPSVPERLDELASRLTDLSTRVEHADEAAASAAEAAAEAAQHVSAVEGLVGDLASLREAVSELAAGPDPSAALAERLGVLADRVEALSIDALGPAAEAAVAGVAQRVEEVAAGHEAVLGASAELAAHLDGLRDEVRGLQERSAAEPALAEGVAALEAALAELALRLDGMAPASTVESLARAVDELQAAVAPLGELGGRLDLVEVRLAESEVRAEAAARATDEAIGTVREHLEAVAETTSTQLEAVLARLAEVGPPGPQPAVDQELRDEVTALAAAVEAVRATVATELGRVEQAWASEREALAERVAAAAAATTSGAGEGSAVPSPVPAVRGATDLARLERDLERLSDRVIEQERSLVEHFARRERALVERLGAGADVGQRLAELGRGIDELRSRVERGASGDGAGGASDEELAALKESFANRLERLASSIDWRFQRLEGGPAAAASRTDLHTRVDQLATMVERLAGEQGGASAGASTATDVVPGDGTVSVFLALVPSRNGHQLVEVAGDVPAPGALLDDPVGEDRLVVVAVGTSPLPGDERPCVFVELADESGAALAVAADAGASA